MSDKEELSRRGRNNKKKGKIFEKSVAEELADWLGLPMTEVWNARSGRKECDIQLSAQAYNLFSYWVEAKNHKSLAIPAWIKQATADAKGVVRKLLDGSTAPPPEPVIVFKQHGDGQKWAIIRFETFMDLATKHMLEKDDE